MTPSALTASGLANRLVVSMARLFDLHIHTTKGSADSSLTPEDLILEAERLGLRGLCITEHAGPWDRHEFAAFAGLHNVVLIRAMEADTDMGHILAFGVDQYQSGFHHAEELSKAAHSAGGFVVSAHPFRGVLGQHHRTRPYLYPDPKEPIPTKPEEALKHRVFELADAVEVANGGTSDDENRFAVDVAHKLGLPVTGGSDAHSTHGLGRFVTEFSDEIFDEAQFLNALHRGDFRPMEGLRQGDLRPYGLRSAT